MPLFFLIVGMVCGAVVGIGIDQKRSPKTEKDVRPEVETEDTPREHSPEVEYDLESQEW